MELVFLGFATVAGIAGLVGGFINLKLWHGGRGTNKDVKALARMFGMMNTVYLEAWLPQKDAQICVVFKRDIPGKELKKIALNNIWKEYFSDIPIVDMERYTGEYDFYLCQFSNIKNNIMMHFKDINDPLWNIRTGG